MSTTSTSSWSGVKSLRQKPSKSQASLGKSQSGKKRIEDIDESLGDRLDSIKGCPWHPFFYEGGLRMPRYGESRYGLFRYGRYVLSGKAKSLQVTRATRIRIVGSALAVRNQQEKTSGELGMLRMRAGEGEWVRTQQVWVPGQTRKVRIRALGGEWVRNVQYEVRGE